MLRWLKDNINIQTFAKNTKPASVNNNNAARSIHFAVLPVKTVSPAMAFETAHIQTSTQEHGSAAAATMARQGTAAEYCGYSGVSDPITAYNNMSKPIPQASAATDANLTHRQSIFDDMK
jgi:hypothetical protein